MREECGTAGIDRKAGFDIISGALSGDGLSHRLVEGGGDEPFVSPAAGNKSTRGSRRRDGNIDR